MLTSELQRQIRQIRLKARHLVDGPFAGDYLSIFKGRGTEFSEVREYEAGDDVRSIDWKVTARLGTPYVKRYIEERELTVMLLADVSASTEFSTHQRQKRQIIAELSTVLGLNAIRHNNRVGLLMFSDRIEAYVAPAKGRVQTTRILAALFSAQARQVGTNISLALETLAKRVPQRTMCFVISDFHDPGYEKAMRSLRKRHALIPVCISDAAEEQWPDIGLATLRDLETGEQVMIDSSDASFQSAYRARHQDLQAARRQVFKRLSLGSIDIETSQSFVGPVKRYFRRRAIGR
ncbi:MAG: DUF58 domain-containing protein [Burkholderiaceae bacterium]